MREVPAKVSRAAVFFGRQFAASRAMVFPESMPRLMPPKVKRPYTVQRFPSLISLILITGTVNFVIKLIHAAFTAKGSYIY
jgi:hypothetical protein